MTQGIKVLAVNYDNPNSIPREPHDGKRESNFANCSLTFTSALWRSYQMNKLINYSVTF